ncbi:uncharacterized protein LOC123402145 [Hordeum vulgare subsp. vulgare]|uniref:uncharacterized protein LOC123402145 n=1 Tax=Hordeum vulgare subsp. vulgare TaxID=112509 RepID=UPI001D1A57E2|nr:uncharacterized protein LOC123402145 [Hordeum vulgare subsp. vulgare]
MDALGNRTTWNCSTIGMLFYATMWKDMYPKGSPKYNLMKVTRKKASHGAKKLTPKIKKATPKVKKPRAHWNPALEKALVDLLDEHNNPYHRGQNGLINHFSYIQSWPDISKFQTKPFPLYDKLGDLYDGHIAEGNYNFTSIEATQVIDDDPEVERDETGFSFDLNQCEDDLLMYDDPRDAAQSDDPSGAIQSDDPTDGTQSDVTRACAPGGSNKKLVKESKKKKRDDPMVEVMENYVETKRKQAEEESALFAESKNAQQFTITKCIAIFLNAAAEDEVSAAVFLRSEMADLPRGI